MKVEYDSSTPAVFGDEVMISFVLKKSRDGKEKDGMVRVAFVDTSRKQIVADVVMSPITAKALSEILKGATQKLDDVLAGKRVRGLKPTRQQQETTYIG